MRADYVIVGAASAGCVLANRLSEDAYFGYERAVVEEVGECSGIHPPLLDGAAPH